MSIVAVAAKGTEYSVAACYLGSKKDETLRTGLLEIIILRVRIGLLRGCFLVEAHQMSIKLG